MECEKEILCWNTWSQVTFYHPVSCRLKGWKGCHDFSVISENFNYDVNTEKTYQTFKILINYLASSSCLFQMCAFSWISQKIECLIIHSTTAIRNLNFIFFVSQILINHCLSFYILIPLQIPYYILKEILFVFWNFQYYPNYLESVTMDSSCTI